MDLLAVHEFLHRSYWCKGIPWDVFNKAAQNSLCFGMLDEERQIAFGRFISDHATFAYLADVYVLQEYRGKGLAHSMISKALALPELQGLRRMMLATRDAHGLYQRFGFESIDDSSLFMQSYEPNVYE
jgi:GNAT superfamily N-acetyltransferase